MFSHDTFQTQITTVMEGLVEAAVSEVRRLLLVLDERRCSSPPAARGATVVVVVKEGADDVTEGEATRLVHPLTTSKFASLMATWTREAAEKIAAMLRTSLGGDGPLGRTTTPRRARTKKEECSKNKLQTVRRAARPRRNHNAGSLLEDKTDKEVAQAKDEVIPEDDITAPPLPLSPDSVTRPPCPACEKTFTLKCWLDRHFLTHSKPHLCPQCGKRFSRVEGLAAHARKHAGAEKPYRCAECATGFAYKSTYSRHMRRHAAQLAVLACAFCEGRFPGSQALQRHGGFAGGKALAEHEDAVHADAPRDLVCETCGECFLSAASLGAHRAAERLVCGKACSHRSALKHHMLTHTGERPFVCETCGKRCGHASALQNHARVHTGCKPPAGGRPACGVCGKRLSSAAKLRYHMSLHTGELPYPCERCGRRFRNPSNLRKHAASHDGAKSYGCAVCGRRFTAARTLKAHGQRHTGERPYRCADCGKPYGQQAQLHRHRLEEHPVGAKAAVAGGAVVAVEAVEQRREVN
ncbi:hypothetical protein NHX12_027541, partial [Muraenolepis orangiensis]